MLVTITLKLLAPKTLVEATMANHKKIHYNNFFSEHAWGLPIGSKGNRFPDSKSTITGSPVPLTANCCESNNNKSPFCRRHTESIRKPCVSTKVNTYNTAEEGGKHLKPALAH